MQHTVFTKYKTSLTGYENINLCKEEKNETDIHFRLEALLKIQYKQFDNVGRYMNILTIISLHISKCLIKFWN